MKMSSMRYILPEPFISIRRNPMMCLTAIATVAITLFLCGMFYLLILNINLNAEVMESAVEVKVFAIDDANDVQLNDMKASLAKIEGVKEVKYVSRERGLELMASRYGDSTRITDALDVNPLPDSFTLMATEPDQVAAIATAAGKLDNVEDVRYGQGSVEKLFSMLNWVRTIGVAIMGMLALSAVILIGMNIRLTVTARREEIEVMKYVGASNSFIAWPFILEGIILSVLGSVIAIAALIFLYSKIITYLTGSLVFMVFLDLSAVIVPVVAGLAAAGLLLGAIGSTFAVRKFLKV